MWGTNRGVIYELFMNRDGTVKKSVQIGSGVNGGPDIPNDSFFGDAVAGLGDLNGDGVTELAVGALGDPTGGTNRGAVYVLFLKPTLPWHNFGKLINDVAGTSSPQPDGSVDANDVLTIINYINAHGSGPIPVNAQIGLPYGFLDTDISNGSGNQVVAGDVLQVINYINAGRPQGGEAPPESSATAGQADSSTQPASAAILTVTGQPSASPMIAPSTDDNVLLLLLATDIALQYKGQRK